MISHKFRKVLSPILFPLSLLFGMVTSVRNKLFDWGILKSIQFKIPVISVGNITVGGTGKTPHVEYLVNLLSQKYNIAVLSRGYKRKTTGYKLAREGVTPEIIGDESFQIFKKYKNISVAVDEKRVHGIHQLQRDIKGLQCVLLDDAYQHRHVKPGVSILLVDYNRPLKGDSLLPMGNLREKRHEVRRANIVVVTKVPHSIKPIEMRIWIKELNLFAYQFLFFTGFRYGRLIPVISTNSSSLPLKELEEQLPDILLVTGIANPQPLYERFIVCSNKLELLHYPDHYHYSQHDVDTIERKFNKLPGVNKMVVTTEKDAVKLGELSFGKTIAERLYYVPIEVFFLNDKSCEFDPLILNYVAEGKKISRLHK